MSGSVEGKRYTEDDLYLKLKGARERLCVAQTALGQGVGPGPRASSALQEALDRIDQVGAFLPQWSKCDMPIVEDPLAGE